MRNKPVRTLFGVAALVILAIGVYYLPPVHERLAWRVSNLRAQIQYFFNPPEEVVFLPGEQAQIATLVQATMDALSTPTPASMATPRGSTTSTSLNASATLAPTPTPTVTPTPMPDKVTLTGIRHEYQKWNNCGPANLSMALSFWGWEGDQRDTAAFTKPNSRDKNVMPYEMAAYVAEETDLKVILRVGGDLDLLKRLIAAGFPVIVEKGFEGPQFDGWMGHYEVVNGYDEAKGRFLVQDSYIMADMPVTYEEMTSYWRSFNYTYIVIYPSEREAEALAILGAQADETANLQYAAQKASDEIYQLSETRDLYFAWFNRGSSLMRLQDYAGAAAAFDQAFALYPTIAAEKRPWRMLWYQTGPYFAYFYTGRYYDVLNLATTTIETANEPAIEESFFWRAKARAALGDTAGAITDLRESLQWHPDFAPSVQALQELGLQP